MGSPNVLTFKKLPESITGELDWDQGGPGGAGHNSSFPNCCLLNRNEPKFYLSYVREGNRNTLYSFLTHCD